MFKMNAVLSKHIKNADEVIDGMVGIEDEEGHEESGDDEIGAAVKDEESSPKKPTLASTKTTGDRVVYADY